MHISESIYSINASKTMFAVGWLKSLKPRAFQLKPRAWRICVLFATAFEFKTFVFSLDSLQYPSAKWWRLQRQHCQTMMMISSTAIQYKHKAHAEQSARINVDSLLFDFRKIIVRTGSALHRMFLELYIFFKIVFSFGCVKE